jgi:hypothetical protein
MGGNPLSHEEEKEGEDQEKYAFSIAPKFHFLIPTVCVACGAADKFTVETKIPKNDFPGLLMV